MSQRNFILLIIFLVIIVGVIFGFLYLNRNTVPTDTTSGGINFISQFNPFASNGTKPPNTPPPSDEPPIVYQPNPPSDTVAKLRKISSMPIAGFAVYSKERLIDVPVPPPAESVAPVDTPIAPDTKTKKTPTPTPPLTEFKPALRYVDRANGNIYQTFADKIQEKRFSTTVIPKIYEAFFGNKGEIVIMRYLNKNGKTIETFMANLPKELLGGDTALDNEIKGVFLPENIADLSLSADASSIFYLFPVGNNLVGTSMNLTTNQKIQVFDSAFTEWLSWWPNKKMLTLTTKPASVIPGYMYAVDPGSKNLMTQVLGNINGLTTLASPNGKLVLFGNNNLLLSVYNIDTKTSSALSVKTLPEKCIWGAVSDVVYCAVPKFAGGGEYPDSWYQGEISFSDQIWKIDIATGNATILVDPTTITGEDIDGIKLALDTDENYLFFVNKKDSFLWEFNLK
jgi:hypothetical protein